MFWKLLTLLVLVAGLGGVLYLSGVTKDQAKEVLHSLGVLETKGEEVLAGTPKPNIEPPPPWDGFVTVDGAEEKAIGLGTAVVEPQTKPIRLELTGRTSYDPAALTKIRPRFDTLVVKVHATLGQTVKKGDPLVELYSTELASAKNDFQTRFVQWQHDLNLYKLREKLIVQGAIAQQVWVDTQNDEKKSRLDYSLARDKLDVFQVPVSEIDPLLDQLRGTALEKQNFGSIQEKAKMTLLSPADGIVIETDVVPGNLYQTSDTLMVIAPLDHLFVWVNVYELDQDKVGLGQTMEIQFPFLEQKIRGTVQYIANEVSKDTRAVKVRATIPNPNARLKSDMLVKAFLDIPPLPSQTVIPRQAMIAINGKEFAFVLKPKGETKGPDKFERRKIEVAQENADYVVVKRGIHSGEVVAATGSLLLGQLYEDQQMVDTGMPPH